MNKEVSLISIAASLFMIMFLCSCSGNRNELSRETMKEESTVMIEEGTISFASKEELPLGFTVDVVKGALLEYINDRFWFYPSDKTFDNYIAKSIDVEIRVYGNDSEKAVYALTCAGERMAIFKSRNGFVYCDGLAGKDGKSWPQGNNYKVIEECSLIIPEAHKPDYGTFQRKTEIIDAIETALRAACEDFYKGADQYYTEWENVDVYISDFYGYQTGSHAWLCRQDGLVGNYPFIFTQENNEFGIHPLKGYDMKKDEFDEYDRLVFERDIDSAVRHFVCNVVTEE